MQAFLCLLLKLSERVTRMINEPNKIAMILSGIVSVLLERGHGNIDVSIKRDDKSTTIIIIQRQATYTDTFIEWLKKGLKPRRKGVVEEYYWRLADMNFESDNLNLVGALIDESEVQLKDNVLRIKVARYIG